MSDLELRNLERAVANGLERPYKLLLARERLGLVRPTDVRWLDQKINIIIREASQFLVGRKRSSRTRKALASRIKVSLTSRENCLICQGTGHKDPALWSDPFCDKCENKSKEEIEIFAKHLSGFEIHSQLNIILVVEPDLATLGIVSDAQRDQSPDFKETFRLFNETYRFNAFSLNPMQYLNWADKVRSDRVQASRKLFEEWCQLVKSQ